MTRKARKHRSPSSLPSKAVSGADSAVKAAGASVGPDYRSGKLEKCVSVRFDAAEFALIEKYAKREGFTVSLLVRRAILQSMRRAGVLPAE